MIWYEPLSQMTEAGFGDMGGREKEGVTAVFVFALSVWNSISSCCARIAKLNLLLSQNTMGFFSLGPAFQFVTYSSNYNYGISLGGLHLKTLANFNNLRIKY